MKLWVLLSFFSYKIFKIFLSINSRPFRDFSATDAGMFDIKFVCFPPVDQTINLKGIILPLISIAVPPCTSFTAVPVKIQLDENNFST